MIHLARLVLCAACLVSISFEFLLLINLSIYLAVMIQLWLFCEWMALKKKNKLPEHDIVLNDLVPLLSQIIMFYKIMH